MPSKGYLAVRFLALNRLDLVDSMISASSMESGRNNVVIDFFPIPFTRKLRLPYSLLRVWRTAAFSPYLVV
jgi:hypothetical protein